jgi:hypothetical protein
MGSMSGHPSVWVREALRVHRRYQVEVVEGCGLCPWAEAARLAGRVSERVILQTSVDGVEASLAAIDDLAAEPATDVAFLVYPRLAVARAPFEEFAARLREADSPRHELGRVPFVLAVFHPDAEPDTGDPERLIPFLRRTPDPTLQLVRAAALDAVRSLSSQGTQFVSMASFEPSPGGPPQVPLRERIARTNLATVSRMGVDAVRRALDDIRRDRDESYARIVAAQPTESSSTSKTSVAFGGMTGGNPRAP